MRFFPLALFVAAILPVSALAERYGSETAVTLQGTYYLVGSVTTKTLANGDTVDTATHTLVQVNNRTILEAMKDRGLIASINGYQLVMVGHAHMADGVAWFASKNTGAPVPVPSDLLSLNVSDGPTNGQLVVALDATLKSLRQQTHNQATLYLDGFIGSGMLIQTWGAKAVKNGTATEVVELIASTGSFSGPIEAPPVSGVGSVSFKLTGTKAVDLTRYGMATTSSSTYSGSSSSASLTSAGCTTAGAGSLTLAVSNSYSGTTIVNSGTFNLAGSGVTVATFNLGSASVAPVDFIMTNAGSLSLAGTTTYTGIFSGSAGTFQLVGLESHLLQPAQPNLTINGGTHNLSSVAFSSTGTVTINNTTGGTVTGLVVDADGNVAQLPTFGTSLPGTLVIITSSGTHTYTHDANGVWTLAAP